MTFKHNNRCGFTLIEMLIVISIIGILAALSAVVMAGAATDAKIAKTKSQIKRIDLLLLERWESYETRPLQITIAPGVVNIGNIQRDRLWAMRELMRVEMPDRFSDFYDFDSDTFRRMQYTPIPAVQRRYVRKFLPAHTAASTGAQRDALFRHENAECLYMILESIEDEFGSGLENFRPTEIGDTDGDGLNEILDAWGNPIQFIRWPAGYQSNVQQVILNDFPLSAVGKEKLVRDQLDPFHRDGVNGTRPASATPVEYEFDTYMLYPLIFSAGPNENYDGMNVTFLPISSNPSTNNPNKPLADASIISKTPDFDTTDTIPAYAFDDPYIYDNDDKSQLGSIMTTSGPTFSRFGQLDNIDNHFGIQE